jgi:aminomethyltransferase
MTAPDEYAVTTQSIGIFDHSGHGKIRVTGKDRVAVLHNILTQDIKNMPPGNGGPAALLAANGKILMLMEVHVLEDSILILVENGHAPKLIALLEKFIITEEVTLEDITADFALYSLAGPNAEWLVVKCLLQNYKTLAEMGNLTFPDGIVMKNSRLGIPGFDLLIPKEKAEGFLKKLIQEGRNMGAKQAGPETEEVLRVEAGVLRYGVDTDENTLLPETGLEKTLASGTKGCYPGQEVVARMETYSGHNRKVRGLAFDGEKLPKPGSKIYAENGTEIGWVTSAVFSKGVSKGLALGYLAKGNWENGLKTEIHSEGNTVAAITAALPFIRRGKGGIQEQSI